MIANKSLSFDIKEFNIDKLLSKSKYQILNFKKDLNKLYILIFDYCSKNNIIISNSNINICVSQNKQYNLTDLDNDFKFNLLSLNPYKDALNLSNLLFTNYSKYIVMSSYLRNKEIIISIDNDKIIKIQLLFLYMEDNKKLNNIQIENFDFKFEAKNYKLQYSTNLYELLHLSHNLYHPSNFLKFYKTNNTKTFIFSQLIKTLLYDNIQIQNKLEYTNQLLEKIRKHLLNEIYLDSYSKIQLLLLDNTAIQSILNNSMDLNNLNYTNTLHILINSKYLDLISKILNNYIESKLDSKKYNLIIKTNIVYIINDFRFKRKNFILINKETGKKNTILYVYNSLDYEVIPTIMENKTLYIPHPLVIIRFLIINLYYMQLFDPSYDKISYNKFLNKINLLVNVDDSTILKKYNLINYIGIFIDERINKFQLGAAIYRPWQYKTKYNKLLS
jgi:hypothetical protein